MCNRTPMKSIINGKRYDTDKAIHVGGYENSYQSDLSWWDADLYKTPRSGAFFLAGTGGPASMFSRSIGQNSWSGGSKLIPMDKDDALAWAERYLDPEVVEEHFGDMIEDA